MDFPKNHCQQDARWIGEQLEQLQHSLRKRVCDRYNEVYSDSYENCGALQHEREGIARFEANSRLREFVSRYGKGSLGECLPPPKLR